MSKPDIDIAPAAPRDASAIVALARESFPHLRLSPLSCTGAASYVQDSMVFNRGSAVRFTVASSGSVVIGMTEVRQTPTASFLNHICVDSRYRGMGVGRRLLSESLSSGASPGATSLGLDVFADNEDALAWYETLGLGTESTTHWVHLDSVDEPVDGWWGATGLPQANAVHAKYGFSQFDLETSSGEYRIGRLGPDIVRTSGIAHDLVARWAVRELCPDRMVFSAQASDSDGRPIAPPSCRMRGRLEDVLAALTA